MSLVPPLATVGLCLQLGRFDDAGGALLLFLTNFAAIVVIACVVFVIFGAAPSRKMLRERHRLRNGFIAAVVALVIISIPLVWNSAETVHEIVWTRAGAPVVRDWIGTRDLQVASWTVAGEVVTINLVGADPPSDAAPLATDLAKAVGGPVELRITYVPVTRIRAAGTP